MHLKKASLTIINQLIDLCNQLGDDEFAASLELLNGNTLGKHIRHVVEFFVLLIEGYRDGIINYDKRQHSELLESRVDLMKGKLVEIRDNVQNLQLGKELVLEVSYDTNDPEGVKLKSSIDRELAYNIEHAIHHMAIIKIAVQTLFPRISLSEHFGIAYSTIRYQKSDN
jgi:uncharacterized damage-inducible protein DinB